jgi:hypothetical protein
MFAGAEALGEDHLVVASLDGRITVLNRQDGTPAAVFETDSSGSNHDRFFTDDGKPDYSGVESLEDLHALYDRQLEQLGGIAGRLAVEDGIVYYATANGEAGALRISGLGTAND